MTGFFSQSVSSLKYAILASYVGHARQTSADVRQRTQTLPDILSTRVQYKEKVWQERKEFLTKYLPVTNWEKCLTGDSNVRQSIECQTFCLADMKYFSQVQSHESMACMFNGWASSKVKRIYLINFYINNDKWKFNVFVVCPLKAHEISRRTDWTDQF